MKIFKVVIYVFTSIGIFYILTVIFLSRSSLIESILDGSKVMVMSFSENSVKGKSKIAISYCNCLETIPPNLYEPSLPYIEYSMAEKLKNDEEQSIIHFFQELDSFQSVHFASSPDQIDGYLFDENFLVYSFCFQRKQSIFLLVEEGIAGASTLENGIIDAYSIVKSSYYFWFFFKWIKYSESNPMTS